MLEVIRDQILLLMNETLPPPSQLGVLVASLSFLAHRQTVWSTEDGSRAAFAALSKWNKLDSSQIVEATVGDMGPISELLSTLPFDHILVSDVEDVDIESESFASELQFGAVAVASVSLRSARVINLFSENQKRGSTMERAFNEGVFLISKKEALYPGYFKSERAFAELVTKILRKGLQQYPVRAMLPSNDALNATLTKLRFATAAALARQAILESRDI